MKVSGGKKMWLRVNSTFPYSLFLLAGLSVTFFGGCFLCVKGAAALSYVEEGTDLLDAR